MSLKHAWLKKKGNRKKWWIISTFLLCALLAVYVFASASYWQAYDERTNTGYQQIKEKAKKALTLPVSSQESKDKKLIALEEVHNAIIKYKDNCKIDLLFLWQQYLPISNQKIDQCRNTSERLTRFNVLLGRMVEYIKDEKILAATLLEAAANSPIAETEMPQLLQRWVVVIKKIENQSVSKDFGSTKDVAVEKARSIHGAWQELIAANSVKNRSKYEQAVAHLAASYDSLGAILQISQQRLNVISVEFERSFSDTFPKA